MAPSRALQPCSRESPEVRDDKTEYDGKRQHARGARGVRLERRPLTHIALQLDLSGSRSIDVANRLQQRLTIGCRIKASARAFDGCLPFEVGYEPTQSLPGARPHEVDRYFGGSCGGDDVGNRQL